MSHRNEVVTGVTGGSCDDPGWSAFVAVVAGIVFVVIHIILAAPPVEDYTPYASGGQVNVVMQTDAQNTVTNHPDWVSYFIQNPQTKQWVHTTYFEVPANTRVNMTIIEYDGCTPLRNPIWGQVTGTIGGVEYVNGQPTSVLNSWSEMQRRSTRSRCRPWASTSRSPRRRP